MTRGDYQIIFTALAFLKLVDRKGPKKTDKAIRKFAALIDEYCFGNSEAPALNDDDVARIDRAIEGHIAELQSTETTCLPSDRATLLKIYDRLQQRKTRRAQAAFYDTGDEKIIADRVLTYLDEEIEDRTARA
jgi:hypothetical protein